MPMFEGETWDDPGSASDFPQSPEVNSACGVTAVRGGQGRRRSHKVTFTELSSTA
jgi:hypothetical protein